MDNLVKFLVNRKFPNIPELQIFELTRTKTKDKQSVTTRMLKENPKTIISLRAKVNSKKKHTVEDKPSESRLQYFCNSNIVCTTKQKRIPQIPVPQTYKNFNNIKMKKASFDFKQEKKLHLPKKVMTVQTRPVTRSIIKRDT